MPRRRRVLAIALPLIVLLGVGGGYWLANREPDPVLRTIVLTSAQPAFFEFDEGEGRLYFLTNDSRGPLSVLNTRSGNPVDLHGALASVSAQPIVDHQSGHYFDADATGGQMLMIDMRTDAVRKRIPIQAYYDYWFDATQDRVVLVFRDPGAPEGLVIDGRTGRVV